MKPVPKVPILWLSSARTSNTFWFNQKLKAPDFNLAASLKELNSAGFTLRNKTLFDSTGHAVEFSVITNSGNQTREKIAAITGYLQETLSGIRVVRAFAQEHRHLARFAELNDENRAANMTTVNLND